MPGTVFEFRFESDKALASLKKLEDGTRRTGQQMDKLDGGAKKIKSSLSGLLGPLKAVATGFAAAFAVKSIIAAADAMTLLRGRLTAATGSANAASGAMAELNRIANQQRTSIAGVADLFTKMRFSISAVAASNADLLFVTEAVSAAMRVTGTEAGTAAGAMTQLSQGLGAGVIRGEEFNSLMEGMAPLMKAIEAQLGLADGALREFAAAGKLTRDVFIDAVKVVGVDFIAAAEKLPTTVGGALQVLRNEWDLLIDAFNQESGFNAALASIIGFFTKIVTGIRELIANWDANWKLAKFIVEGAAKQIALTAGNMMDNLSTVISAGWNFILSAIFSALATMQEAIVNAWNAVINVVAQGIIKVGKLSLGAAEELSVIGKAVAQPFDDAAEAMFTFAAGIEKTTPFVSSLRDDIGALSQESTALITTQQALNAGFDQSIAAIDRHAKMLIADTKATKDVASATEGAVAPLKKLNQQLEKTGKETAKLAKAKNKLSEFLRDLEQQAKAVALTTAEQAKQENVLKALALAQDANITLTEDQIMAIEQYTVASLGGVQAIEEFIQGLEEENKLLQREGVEREKLRAIMEAENIAREAGIELTDEQRQKIEELVAANADLGKSGETAAKIFGDAMKKLGDDIQSSLGDAFYNVFTGGVESFKELAATIKNLFLRMLADLIAFSLANPIRLAIGLGGVGGFGGSAAAAGTLGDIGGLAGGGGGFSSLLNPISSFANPLIGGSIAAIGNFLATSGLSTGIGFGAGLTAAGGSIASAGFLGSAFSSFSAAGSLAAAGNLTAALGVVAPYLAAIVAIAAAFGLFGGGKKSKGKLFTEFTEEGAILKESVDKHFELQAFEKTIDGIFTLTSTVLNAIGGKQAGAFVGLKQTEDGLTGLVGPPGDTGTFTLIGKVDPEDEQGVQDLFAQMAVAAIQQSDLSEVAAPLAAFFKQMTEESIEQLSAQDVSQLFDWVVNIADAAEIAGQKFPQITTLIENFVGSIDEAVAFTDALIAIGVAMDTTPLEDYQAIIEANSVSVTDAAHNAFMAAKELALGYDGSTSATIKLAQAVVAYKQAAILAAAAIAQAFDTVNAITLNSVEQIKLAGMTTEQQYDYFTTQAETLAASLDTLTDPAEIAKVVEQINKFSLAAFNLLSPEEQAKMGDAFIAFLEGVKLKADTKLTELGEGVEEDFKDLDATIDLSLLDAAAVSIKESSDTQSAAARRMESAASVMQGAGDQQLAAAARFNAAVAGIPSSITVNVVGSEIGGA